MTGILVMLNNFLHDFAVAMMFCSLLTINLAIHPAIGIPRAAQRRLYLFLARVLKACWFLVIAGGAVRTWAYREYEWLPAAGRGQVEALVVKHVLLVSVVLLGIWGQYRARRRIFR